MMTKVDSFFPARIEVWFAMTFIFFASIASTQVADTALTSKATPRTLKLVDANIDFYTTFTKNNSSNSQEALFKNNLYFYYNFTLQNRIKLRKLRIANYFFNEFGIRNYKDSIVAISEDAYTFKNSISWPVKKSKLECNLSITSRSQFWPHYLYKLDSTRKYQKQLYTSYLSPGYTIYSGGLRFLFWDRSSLELGLASGKTVKIKNQDIFIERKAKQLYGLEQGVRQKTVIGFHVLLNIASKELFKNFCMEQFSQVFMDARSLDKVQDYTFDINNAFHFMFLKYARLSLRTKCLYDNTINHKPALIQQLSIGFYLRNKLD